MCLRNVGVLTLTVAVAGGFSSCSCYSLKQPKDGDVVRLPAKTAIVIDASPSLSAVAVKLDGADVSNQVSWSVTPGQGDLSVPAGKHNLTAEADVPCWYCSGQKYRPSGTANFCVAGPWPSTTATSTALAKGDGRTWTKSSETTVGVAPDAVTPMNRWNLVRVGGIGQSLGIIQSTENTCLCMVSTADQSDTPIGLAICNSNDHLHLWQALLIPNTNSHYRFQNFGRSVSSACLTEGANGVLVQRGCLDTDDQLWRIRDNASGNIVPPF